MDFMWNAFLISGSLEAYLGYKEFERHAKSLSDKNKREEHTQKVK